VGLFLNIVDSFVKPFLTVISLPLTIITLGIFQLVVNSFMLELASYLSVNLLGVGISIASFGSAFMGSILVSITRSILDSIAED
jgi:putative membrane protein